MIKRLFDIVSSLTALIVLAPLLLILAVIISLESAGGPFYIQTRVGRNGKKFGLVKFRSMRKNSDKTGQLTIGRDPRITTSGRFIRKFKLDELPQLFNVLIGQMSIVGPRPEVPKYVEMYNEEQREVLSVRPGLTDYASIEYIQEDELLGKSDHPEKTYLEEIMPAKLKLNKKYIENRSFKEDLRLIFLTMGKLFS